MVDSLAAASESLAETERQSLAVTAGAAQAGTAEQQAAQAGTAEQQAAQAGTAPERQSRAVVAAAQVRPAARPLLWQQAAALAAWAGLTLVDGALPGWLAIRRHCRPRLGGLIEIDLIA